MKCKLCNAEMKCIIEHGRDYFVGENKHEEFSIYYCTHCKIGFTYPEMSDSLLDKYYPKTYEAYVSKKNLFNTLQVRKYRSDMKLVKKHMKHAHISVYEIGSGRGQFLAELKRKWKNISVIQGAEQSVEGVKNALKEYGIELEQKRADDIVFTQKYTLVILRHVLEHLNNFDLVIQNIYTNGLEEGGLLFIKIPRLNSYEMDRFGRFFADLDVPRHRVHFTDSGMRNFLKNNGFKNIKIYNEIVPSSYDRSMQYEKKGVQYLSEKTKIFRYLLIELKLLRHRKKAGRMIVIAEK